MQNPKRMIVLNIGWMSHYKGQKGQPDKIVNGGSHIDKFGEGDEVCNFVACEDGYVYGHVETIKDKKDRNILLENLGISASKDDKVAKNVTIIWVATDPNQKGRTVVGIYRDAEIFRKRQKHTDFPSKQHKIDNIDNFRIRCRSRNAFLLPLESRNLRISVEKGFIGQVPWWAPKIETPSKIIQFLENAVTILQQNYSPIVASKKSGNRPARKPYTRYISDHEMTISPRHHELQSDFCEYLKLCEYEEIEEDKKFVDVRFKNKDGDVIFCEVKPCNKSNARFAIRTAIGQILDYKHSEQNHSKSILVLEIKPKKVDMDLALSNGFSVAYPHKDSFKIKWHR